MFINFKDKGFWKIENPIYPTEPNFFTKVYTIRFSIGIGNNDEIKCIPLKQFWFSTEVISFLFDQYIIIRISKFVQTNQRT